MNKANPSQPLDGIAIIGMAGRFPGARNCDEFWQNLREGREGLTYFSDEALAAASCALSPHHEKRVRSRGVVDDTELFDAAFFGYTPKEAEIMDPQQRVFLEVAWTALENAGFDPDRVPGAVGIFGGASINTYYPTNVVSRPDILGPFGVFPAVVLNEKDFLASRVAYKLNLRGPAISVQTACSTSLVAVCTACQSLLSFECDLALAGGVAINFPHCHSYIHEEGGMISADGHCRPFDKNATGTLFSDGAGVVALRRLEDAVAAGDTILAVIKGFAVNNDGSDKAGFGAPSVNGQARVIQMAQAFGEVKPDSISYVEAHGTATPLGDPIEIAALTQAFRAGTGASQFCAIGSVKSNIGHSDVAAGIAGLIKTVLALQHRELPPTIHFTGPNPKIDFASTPFFVVDRLLEWETPPGIPRRAGVSSFGIGGTNAHMVLEEAPKVSPSGPSRTYQLLSLSARSQVAVDTATANLAGHLTAHPELPLADVAYTLQMGRHQFNHRRFVVCRDRAEALAQLGAERVMDHPALVPARYDPPVVFMFPGQGAQRVNMGRELYETESLYRETVDACARVLTTDLGLDLREVLFPLPDKLPWAEEQIVQTRITQPALFVTEYALARLWMAWGVRPAAMIGHSVGEYVAACLSGVFSLNDGLRVIAARGRLIQQQPRGAMLAVMAGEEEVRPLLPEGVSIAAVNAPCLCVASGSHDAIALMEKVLADAGKVFRRLQTSHAFHSAMMEPVVAPFTEFLQGVKMSRPQLPFVSNPTAAWITDGEATSPSYWAQHLRQAVRFADGVAVLLGKADHVLLEVGPGSTLTTLARQHPSKKSTQVVVPSLPSGRDQLSDIEGVLGAMGRLWQAGVEVDWAGFHSSESRRRVSLPSYPFERKRFFIEPGRAEYVADTAEKRSSAVLPAAEAILDAAVVSISHRERILARLHARLQALSGLSVEELGPNTTFFEMGFDSLFLTQLIRVLDVEFGVSITLRQVVEDLSSISRLADYLETALSDDSDKGPAPAPPVATKAAADAFLPMTDAQREVWIAAQVGEDLSRTYNEAYLIRIQGPLRADVLRESLQEIVNRHDALRATFAADGSGQTIAGRVQVELAIHSLAGRQDDAVIDRWLNDLVHAATVGLFDLAAGPLFRFSLFDLGEQHWAVLLVIHHLIADGWSWGIILEELGEIYTAKAEGRALPDRPALQYCDYVSWEGSPSQQARVASAEAYWLELLADRPEEFELPTDRPRPSRKTYKSGRVRHTFDATLVPGLKEAARNFNCTLFHLLTASFHAWLHRVTGREDLIVAVPTAGQAASGLRELSHADRLVGHCVNMLPVRLRCAGGASFREFLQHARTRLLDARDHQDVSFDNLINKLQWPRDASRAPLASVSLNFIGREHQLQLAGLVTDTQPPPKAFNFFDLTADVLESHDELVVDCKFNSDLFDASTVARWLVQWEHMLAAAVAYPDTAIDDQNILSGDERRQLLIEWNATEREFPRDACLHQLVEQQADLVPERVAVECDGRALTYRELERRANRLARRLTELGVGPNVLVGVCVERGVDMVVALLGVLKAGGAYVPLDPAYPPDRVQYVLDDARAPVLITEAALLRSLGVTKAEVVCLDRDVESIARLDSAPVSARACATDLAYVIYTSGSTGKPKGVQIEHRAVVNFLFSMQREPGFRHEDILLAVTTLSFDIAGLELYLPLVTGGKVVIASRGEAQDPWRLMQRLHEANCTMMQATPATWRSLLNVGWNGSAKLKILCGGESFPRDLAQNLLPRCSELWNMYGPTETTIWSTVHRILAADCPIPIGRAIANTRVYVLDAHHNLVPRGAIGELYIGGDGLARGYFGRPQLTNEKFVPSPFTPEDRLYRTGDLARWLPDGTLECLGRIDTQVKIRGFRIELGEIEAVLSKHPTVKQCVVVAREDTPGDKQLVAYFETQEGANVSVADLRLCLNKELPDYMLPAAFVPMDSLPLTPNGKIDRKALPSPEGRRMEAQIAFLAPRDSLEEALANIWSKMLGVKQVGMQDDFFASGGNSLLAVSMLLEVNKLTGKILPLATFFECSTIGGLAAILRGDSRAPSCVAKEWQQSSNEKAEPLPIVREARFEEKEFAGILTVLRQVFPIPYAACSHADFIREQNRKWLANPARTTDQVYGWVLESPTDGIVGFTGEVPVRVKIGEEEIVGAAGCAFGVLPAYRAYSRILMKQLMERGGRQLMVATTANEISSTLNEAMGMHPIPVKDFSRRLLWLLRPEVPVKLALGRSRWKALRWLAEQLPGAYLLKGIARLWFVRHRRLRFTCPKLSVEPVVSFTEEFNDLWENNKKDYDITTVRDQAFLNWRHCEVDSLMGRTFVFACRDHGQIRGYIALQTRFHESDSYVVTDLFYERTRKDVLHNLMNYAFEFAKARGCSIFHVSGYSNEVIEELKTQRPYIRRGKSCSYWYKGSADIEAKLCDEKRWWPSGADGDSNL